jgi:hypothetical protein
MLAHAKEFIGSRVKLVIISKRICDTDKSEVQYVAKNPWGREIRGSRLYDRKTPFSHLIETIQADLAMFM